MRGDDEHQSTMFSYISADQRVPTDHPLRPVRSMADEALRAALPTISEAVRVNRTTVNCARATVAGTVAASSVFDPLGADGDGATRL